MVFNDTLNTKNLYTSFGLIIQTGTQELLTYPERKPSLENDWAEENGKEYDLATPKFKDKEVILRCAFMTANDTAFWTAYHAFFTELTKPNWQALFIADHGKTYQIFYKKTTNFKKTSKRLKNVPKVFVKFDLTLQVKFE